VKFGVLGPYLIFPGRPHRVQAAKHRNLLAILTVNANAFVSIDRLADELWLGAPPLSAPNLVRQYISSVRRALPDTGLIATMPSGYRLLLHPGDLDRDEFDAFVELARAELAVDAPWRARALRAIGRARGDDALVAEAEEAATGLA
jgi:DNA-binding SARP family transcriptional activator